MCTHSVVTNIKLINQNKAGKTLKQAVLIRERQLLVTAVCEGQHQAKVFPVYKLIYTYY